MASFEEHINQSKSNLKFLVETNLKSNSYWDWQVTVAFYTALHVVNAHMAKAAGLHYRTHEDVKNALNPFNQLSITKVAEPIYLCYVKLEGLSRRARYLCHEDHTNQAITAHISYDKHLAKAVRKLDELLDFFIKQYGLKYDTPIVSCPELSPKENLKIFKIKSG